MLQRNQRHTIRDSKSRTCAEICESSDQRCYGKDDGQVGYEHEGGGKDCDDEKDGGIYESNGQQCDEKDGGKQCDEKGEGDIGCQHEDSSKKCDSENGGGSHGSQGALVSRVYSVSPGCHDKNLRGRPIRGI